MNYLILILRIIHILSGVFWAGAAMMMTLFVIPSVGATGEAGQKFMGHFIGKTKLQAALTISSILTILAGTVLYLDKPAAWFSSGAGIGFGIGAVFAVIGWVFGMLIGQNNKKMGILGAQIQGQPTPEQLTKLQRIQKSQRMFSSINVTALTLAVLFMATARYFTF